MSEARHPRRTHAVEIRRGITIQRPREDVYHWFRALEDLAGFTPSRQTPQLVGEVVGERLEWRAPRGSFDHVGRVELRDAPGGRGTEAVVVLRYEAPGPFVGPLLRFLRRVTAWRLGTALARMRQFLETGEVARSV
jgi:uncharacterized membrane protein